MSRSATVDASTRRRCRRPRSPAAAAPAPIAPRRRPHRPRRQPRRRRPPPTGDGRTGTNAPVRRVTRPRRPESEAPPAVPARARIAATAGADAPPPSRRPPTLDDAAGRPPRRAAHGAYFGRPSRRSASSVARSRSIRRRSDCRASSNRAAPADRPSASPGSGCVLHPPQDRHRRRAGPGDAGDPVPGLARSSRRPDARGAADRPAVGPVALVFFASASAIAYVVLPFAAVPAELPDRPLVQLIRPASTSTS